MIKLVPKPEMLAEPEWLEAHLDDPAIRIIDCTATLVPQPVGPSVVVSGKPKWDAGHIPGSTYLHMVDDLSAPREGLPYNLPDEAHITRILQRIGVNRDTIIVLYGSGYQPAVTRAWWVLRASGASDVRILNGGYERWVNEARPVTSEATTFTKGDFEARQQPALLAPLATVTSALNNPDFALVNALSPEQFHGTGGAHYGRPGRIPGSVNIPSRELIEPATNKYKSSEELRAMFDRTGALDRKHVIAYCGGGIAASATVFVLELLGHPGAALYDQSLLEWSKDPALPLTRDA